MAQQQTLESEQEWAGDFDPFSDPEERRVLYATIDSFKQYRRTAHLTTTHRRRQNFYALPRAHWEMLAESPFNIQDTLNHIDDAIDVNADIAEAILTTGLDAFGLPADPEKESELDWRGKATSSDLHKAHQTIRQFYRDWSAEGVAERRACYDPVLADLEDLFPRSHQDGDDGRAALQILVPGAGLGRLVFEICRAGFSAEGNEISYHQLLASSWILNHTARAQEHDLYPFVREFSNLESRSHQLQKVQIPDVHPGALTSAQATQRYPPGSMSMSAADFVTLYGGARNYAAYDAVATVFFVDTAPNVIRYVETIRNCLKPGGVWINLGPLLWHFDERSVKSQREGSVDGTVNGEDSVHDDDANTTHHNRDLGIGEPGSIELTNEEVLQLVGTMGFKIERAEMRTQECGYIQGPRSMLQHMYRVSHWVARKI